MAKDLQTLPSGAVVRFSPLTARQANILADGVEKSTTSTTLLASCTVEVLDPGPYPVVTGNASGFGWRRALIGDRLAALLYIRAKTYGPSYEFDVKCPVCPIRADLFKWAVQIPDDLTIKPYPAETLIAFREGRRSVTITLPDGRTAEAKIITGEDEELAQEHARKLAEEARGKETTAMLSRLFVTVDGEPSRPELFEDVPFPLIPEYVDAASAIVGGVETLIDTQCTRCGLEVPVQLPFGRTFFLPQRKRNRLSGNASIRSAARSFAVTTIRRSKCGRRAWSPIRFTDASRHSTIRMRSGRSCSTQPTSATVDRVQISR